LVAQDPKSTGRVRPAFDNSMNTNKLLMTAMPSVASVVEWLILSYYDWLVTVTEHLLFL